MNGENILFRFTIVWSFLSLNCHSFDTFDGRSSAGNGACARACACALRGEHDVVCCTVHMSLFLSLSLFDAFYVSDVSDA